MPRRASRGAARRPREANHKGRPSEPPLDAYFNSLFTAFGPQRWWPGKTPFEIIVGAILTQSTSWASVERALANLRTAELLTPLAIERASTQVIQEAIRPSGYFRGKARKLKAFCAFLRFEYQGSLKKMFAEATEVLRDKLLRVYGIGPETADAILLYAGGHPAFVVDAYTKRILSRHGWVKPTAKYKDVRWIFERQFPGDVRRFNEFHALIVETGKKFCHKANPDCAACPLGRYLEEGS